MGKILVFGDSITYGKWDSEGGWVTRLRDHIDEKYNLGKNNNFQVYNLGIPGEVAPRLSDRFEEELKYRIDPEDNNLVIIAVGVNDSCPNNWMTEEQTTSNNFKSAFSNMINIARSYKCSVICLGLTPVEPKKAKKLKFTNEEVNKYEKLIEEVCVQKDVAKISLFSDLLENDYRDLLVDSVHPNDKGHMMILHTVLEFLEKNGLIKYCLGEENE